MRIVLLNFHFYEYTLQLANALSRKAEVLLLQPRNWTNNYPDLLAESLSARFFARPRRVFDPRNLWQMFKVMRWINSYRPDVLHLNGVYPWLCPWLPALKRKCPIVTTIHAPALYPKYARKHIQLATETTRYLTVRFSDQILVHGVRLREGIMKRYGLKEDRVWAIPHGGFSIYKNWEEVDIPEEKEVLFFGMLKNNKGLEYLIKAEPLITREVPEARIVLAGKGDLRPYEQGMKNKEHFRIYNEYIPPERVAWFFQRASVVVLPYLFGSQSGVLAISQVFGKPVVVTDVGSLPEVVEDGKTGFVVPPRDPVKLAEAVVKLLQNDDLREEMKGNTRKYAETELSWDKIAERTMEVYRRALSSSPPTTGA